MKSTPTQSIKLLGRVAASLALASVLAPAVLAQGSVDVVGIYTTKDGTGSSDISLTPGFPNTATAYVCMTGIQDPMGVQGWEFTLSGTDISDGVVVTSWDLTWGTPALLPPLNIASPPEFIVGLGGFGQSTPIPWSPNICVLSFTFFVTDAAPKAFFIHPTSVPSIPGQGAYVGGTSAGALYPLNWAYGGEPYVAFTVNSQGSSTPRSGALGLNPGGYESTIEPFEGTPWLTTIDTTPTPGSTTLSTVQFVGLGGPFDNWPLFGYEMLCLPPYFLVPGAGEHSLPIPSGTSGQFFTTQGARVELDPMGNLDVVLLNAIDIVIG